MMSYSGALRKNVCLFMLFLVTSALSGCASMLNDAVGGLVETVVETTVEAVVDVTIDAVVHTAVDVGAHTAVACIDNDKPVLSGALPSPVLNQEYNAMVHVGIRNEPYDDAYSYAFEVYGDFPPGMSSEGVGRQLRLTGVPTLPGDYHFQVRVRVEDGLHGAKNTKGLCFTVDEESFQWTIQQSEPAQIAS